MAAFIKSRRTSKITRSYCIIKLGLFLLFVFSAGSTVGQNNMLIRKLSGKEIQRLSYDKKGNLESRQVFQISKLDSSQEILSVKMEVQVFNRKGKLENRYSSTYTCRPDKSDILLSVIPLSANKNTKYVVEANTNNFESLYNFSDKFTQLKDIAIDVNVKSGVLGFLGSKSKITISNRNLIRKEQNYTINSDLTVDAFLLGVIIKSVQYHVVENLSNDKSLLNQKFINLDGSYFVINYINNL